MPDQFELGVVVPDYAIPTKESRAILPDCYSLADTVFNVQRTALLVAALAKGDAPFSRPRSKTGCTSPSARSWCRDWPRFCGCASRGCSGVR